MKRIIILALFFISYQSYSQEYSYEVTTDNIAMSQGTNPCYILTISDASDKLLEHIWKDYLHDEGVKLKKDRKTKEYHGEDFTIEGSGKTYDVIAAYNKKGDDAQLYVWLLDEDGNFLEPSDDDAEKIQDHLDQVAYDVKLKGVENEMKEEEDKLKDLHHDLEKLKKKKEKMEEETADCEKLIKSNQTDIESFTKEKSDLELEMNPENEEGKPVVELTSDEIKDLEKEMKKKNKDIKRNNRQIERCENKIKDNNKDIPRNLDEQEKVSQQIELQNEIVEQVRVRLSDVKSEKN